MKNTMIKKYNFDKVITLKENMLKSSMMLGGVLLLAGCASAPSEKREVSKEIIAQVQPSYEYDVPKNKGLPLPKEVDGSNLFKGEKKFNINVKNVPVKTVLDGLFEQSNYNVIYEEGSMGNISLNLRQTTMFDLLETLKRVYSYDYEVKSNSVYIYPNAVRTKVYNINHLIGTRLGRTDLKITSGSISSGGSNNTSNNGSNNTQNTGNTNSGSTETESSRVTTTVDSNFWKELQNNVSILLSGDKDALVATSPETNSLIVKAKSKDLFEIERYLKKIQVVIDKQVVIEAKIIEVQLKNGAQKGINWAAFGSGANGSSGIGFTQNGVSLGTSGNVASTVGNNVTINPGASIVNAGAAIGGVGGSIFSIGLQSANFAAILNFLETQGNLQVLSSPRIATMNNQKALLKVGTDEFFITNVTTTTTSTGSTSSTTPSVTTQPFFSGIALDITPQIDPQGSVTMHVRPAVSQVSTVTKNVNLGTLGNLVLPLASSTISETDSVVKVENNKIVAIGGLMKQYNRKDLNKVPGLSNAPVIGEAFKNSDDEYLKYELVILLKPQVIENQSDWDKNLEDIRTRLINFDTNANDIKVEETIKNEEKSVKEELNKDKDVEMKWENNLNLKGKQKINDKKVSEINNDLSNDKIASINLSLETKLDSNVSKGLEMNEFKTMENGNLVNSNLMVVSDVNSKIGIVKKQRKNNKERTIKKVKTNVVKSEDTNLVESKVITNEKNDVGVFGKIKNLFSSN